jgi:hypothetical protein
MGRKPETDEQDSARYHLIHFGVRKGVSVMQRVGWLVLCSCLVLGLAGTASVAPAWAQTDSAATGGSIEGFVFLDTDADGALGPSESGLRIVPVQLKGPVNRTVLSSMNGAYRFTDLPAGNYDILVEPGPEWQVQSQGMYAGLAVNGDRLENVNFALEAVDASAAPPPATATLGGTAKPALGNAGTSGGSATGTAGSRGATGTAAKPSSAATKTDTAAKPASSAKPGSSATTAKPEAGPKPATGSKPDAAAKPGAAQPGSAVDAVAAASALLGALSEGDGDVAVDPDMLAALTKALDEVQAEGGTPTLDDLFAKAVTVLSTLPEGSGGAAIAGSGIAAKAADGAAKDDSATGSPAGPGGMAKSDAPAGSAADRTGGGLTPSVYGTSSYDLAPSAYGTAMAAAPAAQGATGASAAGASAAPAMDSGSADPQAAPAAGMGLSKGGAPMDAPFAAPQMPQTGIGAPSRAGFALALVLALGAVALAGMVLERR